MFHLRDRDRDRDHELWLSHGHGHGRGRELWLSHGHGRGRELELTDKNLAKVKFQKVLFFKVGQTGGPWFSFFSFIYILRTREIKLWNVQFSIIPVVVS